MVKASERDVGCPKISFYFSACSATAFRVSHPQAGVPSSLCDTLKAVAEQALKEKLILGLPEFAELVLTFRLG